MADNLTVTTQDGNVDIRTRETASGIHAHKTDVAPWVPTVVSGAQYGLAVSSSAVTLTVPSGATHALISVSGTAGDYVSFTEDSSTPTAANGIKLAVGTVVELPLPNALKFIRVSADITLNVTSRKYI